MPSMPSMPTASEPTPTAAAPSAPPPSAPPASAPTAAAPTYEATDTESDYDIEAELADAIADDLDTRSFTRNRKPRKPVGTVRVGNETVVVCDDGSTWRRTERGWRQVAPLPGTPVQLREPRIERAG
jgi:hypothetical protein